MDVLLLRDEIRDYASIYKGREHRECGLSLYVDTVLETELKTADDFQQYKNQHILVQLSHIKI